MRAFAFLGALLAAVPGRLLAQTAPPPAAAEIAERVRLTVEREFGPRFKLVAKFQPMLGDFDGDGKEDLAVVVTGSPALDQAAHNYKLIDPYDAISATAMSGSQCPFPFMLGDPLYVAIAHDWRAPHPKAKFVIVNLPFERIEVSGAQIEEEVGFRHFSPPIPPECRRRLFGTARNIAGLPSAPSSEERQAEAQLSRCHVEQRAQVLGAWSRSTPKADFRRVGGGCNRGPSTRFARSG